MSEKIKTLIIDDEAGARNVLSELIPQLNPRFEVVATADNAAAGREALLTFSPKLVFLDIQMPGMNGFELLRSLPQPVNFKVIFATAHDRYAIEAVRVAALDFLTKPVSPAELKAALQRFTDSPATEEANRVSLLLGNTAQPPNVAFRIAIPDLKGFSILTPEQVLFLEADGNYTIFHLVNGSRVTATKLLKEYEEMLAEKGFCRIHQSHIINLAFVRRYLKGNLPQVELENGTILNIARQRRDAFLKHFPEFLVKPD